MSETVNETNEVTPEGEVTEESVREALRGVMDPELHLDVVTLGLIRSVHLDSAPAVVKMLKLAP
jgi:metal-sulfur cluster biosynthetic enzyme